MRKNKRNLCEKKVTEITWETYKRRKNRCDRGAKEMKTMSLTKERNLHIT